MGFFDGMFDFNGDGHVDSVEMAMGMEMIYEESNEDMKKYSSNNDDDLDDFLDDEDDLED